MAIHGCMQLCDPDKMLNASVLALVMSSRNISTVHLRKSTMWFPGGVYVFYFFYSLSIPINVHFSIMQANTQCYLAWHVITLPFKDLDSATPSEHAFLGGGITGTLSCNHLKGVVFEALQLLIHLGFGSAKVSIEFWRQRHCWQQRQEERA